MAKKKESIYHNAYIEIMGKTYFLGTYLANNPEIVTEFAEKDLANILHLSVVPAEEGQKDLPILAAIQSKYPKKNE